MVFPEPAHASMIKLFLVCSRVSIATCCSSEGGKSPVRLSGTGSSFSGPLSRASACAWDHLMEPDRGKVCRGHRGELDLWWREWCRAVGARNIIATRVRQCVLANGLKPATSFARRKRLVTARFIMIVLCGLPLPFPYLGNFRLFLWQVLHMLIEIEERVGKESMTLALLGAGVGHCFVCHCRHSRSSSYGCY